jgi:deoxyribonuclease V
VMALPKIPQEWLQPSSLTVAAKVQKTLADKVQITDQFSTIDLIAGVDVSNNLRDPKQMVYAAAVLLNANDLSLNNSASHAEQQVFPYIPGFLGFREAPAICAAIQKLPHRPDLILVDGHGISHPRGLGIASHIGVLLDIPTIGVAKSILVGKAFQNLSELAGAKVPLIYQNKTIAMLLRSKTNCLPLIISPGHKISLTSAVTIVQQCLKAYRLPEPTRFAHLAANQCRKMHMQNEADLT